jgi:hypothetical protein
VPLSLYIFKIFSPILGEENNLELEKKRSEKYLDPGGKRQESSLGCHKTREFVICTGHMVL